jgi:hypothetical protein
MAPKRKVSAKKPVTRKPAKRKRIHSDFDAWQAELLKEIDRRQDVAATYMRGELHKLTDRLDKHDVALRPMQTKLAELDPAFIQSKLQQLHNDFDKTGIRQSEVAGLRRDHDERLRAIADRVHQLQLIVDKHQPSIGSIQESIKQLEANLTRRAVGAGVMERLVRVEKILDAQLQTAATAKAPAAVAAASESRSADSDGSDANRCETAPAAVSGGISDRARPANGIGAALLGLGNIPTPSKPTTTELTMTIPTTTLLKLADSVEGKIHVYPSAGQSLVATRNGAFVTFRLVQPGAVVN